MTEKTTKLEVLIKQAKDDFRQYISTQPKIENELTPEKIKELLKQASDKESEYLAHAINKYIINEVMVEIVKLQSEVSKIKRQLINNSTND